MESGVMSPETIKQLFPEINMITDPTLADKVTQVWLDVWKRSNWKNLEDVPYTTTIKKSAIRHLRSTARSAVAVAKIMKELHGVEVNLDYLVAGALLHDVSKLVEYSSQGGRTSLGQKIPHGAYGIAAALAQDLPVEVVHIIASHTPHLRKMPESVEAIIVRHVDGLEADCHALLAGETLFSSRTI
jgi:putative nucleotidyltransferase with HDIG domain